jgi:ATP/maltotriose-dependent transcriptional regulator MalT
MRQAGNPAAAPMGGRRIIERPRLIKLLEGTSARTILLIAPAGYGKTTLARQWAERQDRVHWYTARAGSADVAQLAVDLAETLDGEQPRLKTYVSQLVRARSSPAHQAMEIVSGFAGAAGDMSGVSLFIDDYHLIADEEVAEWFVHELQSRLGFSLLIAARSRPRWATARLQIYGETVEFGPEELALTETEGTEVLGRSLRSRGLVAQARGWPALVALASQTDANPAHPEAGGSTLFRFFAEEIFRGTPTDIQEKLITLSLLPNLSKPVVDSALDADSQHVLDRAVQSGLATIGPEYPDFHPLVQEYLLTKLRERDDASDRVRAAFDTSIDGGFWDHAFALVERFAAIDLLDRLVQKAFKPLLSSGRIATLELIAQFGHGEARVAPSVIELIDAELAFRSGLFERSASIAAGVASNLEPRHRLGSHAWWLAGMSAQLSSDDVRAAEYFDRAKTMAQDDDDLGDALWGLVVAACQSERPNSTDALQQVEHRRERSPVDFVRSATAELYAWRLGVTNQAPEIERALHELEHVEDPRIRTGFLNQYVYTLILWGRYDTAYAAAQAYRKVIDEYRLTWARPHAEWALAAAALGRRQFAVAANWLKKVEQAGDELKYGQLVLNASCVRSRMLLALNRPEEARSALVVDETLAANPAMRGELLAMRALVLAVIGDVDEALAVASTANRTTISVETRAYTSCVRAVCAERVGGNPDDLLACTNVAERLQVWDPFVVAVRARPQVLKQLVQVAPLSSSAVQALRNSNDYDLARQAGVDLGRRPAASASSAISPREREVLELIRQGLTNAEIARALFISRATVKVHVGHIFEKTGTRSRAEAAATVD